MKNPLCFLAILIFATNYGYCQISRNILEKTIPLNIATNVNIKKESGSEYRKLLIEGEEISKIYISNGELDVKFGSESFKAMPENYNIGVALIKNNSGKVIGMSKKYGKVHLVGIGNRIFKIERQSSPTQYKLWELQDGKSENKAVPKRIIIQQGRQQMEIFHNLDDIPLTAIPFLINTKGVDNNISNKVLKGFLATLALTAIRVAIVSTN